MIRPLALAIVLVLASATATLAASPTPSAGGADPRSPGQGPGLVGDPVFAVVAVAGIAVAAVILTLAYLRLTQRRSG